MLFASPTGDWESVTATALRADRGDPAARRLTLLLMAGYTVVFATILSTGLAGGYLSALLAVPAGPAELGLQAAPLLLPVPMLWILRAYLRGSLMARHHTRRLAVAAAAHLGGLIGVAAAMSRTPLPGVVAACLTLLGGLLIELAVLTIGGAPAGSRLRIGRALLPRGVFRAPGRWAPFRAPPAYPCCTGRPVPRRTPHSVNPVEVSMV
jgi:hypothetical protein